MYQYAVEHAGAQDLEFKLNSRAKSGWRAIGVFGEKVGMTVSTYTIVFERAVEPETPTEPTTQEEEKTEE